MAVALIYASHRRRGIVEIHTPSARTPNPYRVCRSRREKRRRRRRAFSSFVRTRATFAAFAHGSGCLKTKLKRPPSSFLSVDANTAVITNRFAVPRTVTFSCSLLLRVTNCPGHPLRGSVALTPIFSG